MSIDDLIYTQDSIIQKRKNPSLYIAFIFAGIGSLIAAYSPALMDKMNLITGLWVLGIGLILSGVIGIAIPKKVFYYKPTGELLKRSEMYFSTKDKARVISAIQEGDLTRLPNPIENTKAAMMLVVYCTSNNNCMMAQPMEYVPFQFVATHPAVIHER